MRALLVASCLLAACATSHEAPSGGGGALRACFSRAACMPTELCLPRAEADGGTFCTESLGSPCRTDDECAAAYRCSGFGSDPVGTCIVPSTTVTPCTSWPPPHEGDACDPLPTGLVCHPSSCTESGLTCECRSGRWRCGTEARDYHVDLGTGVEPPLPACGTPPLCWELCGRAPP